MVDQKSLTQCMESLTQKLHPGVVIHFLKLNRGPKRQDSSTPMDVNQSDELVGGKNGVNQEAKDNNGSMNDGSSVGGGDGGNGWHSTRKMIYVKINPKTNRPSGYWPIPESYWPELNLSVLVSTKQPYVCRVCCYGRQVSIHYHEGPSITMIFRLSLLPPHKFYHGGHNI